MKKKNQETGEETPPANPNPKDRMYRTLNNESLVKDIGLHDILFRCGELQLDYQTTCSLCVGHIHEDALYYHLNNPLSEYYIMYVRGVAEGKMKLIIDLEHNVGEPKAKDAYKHLSAERRRQAINQKLEELFDVAGV